MNTEHELLSADTAEAVMRAKDEILSMADSLIEQTAVLPADEDNLGVVALREHRAAISMAEELMMVHESESPSDELLYIYAESLMLWHLRETATLLEIPLL